MVIPGQNLMLTITKIVSMMIIWLPKIMIGESIIETDGMLRGMIHNGGEMLTVACKVD